MFDNQINIRLLFNLAKKLWEKSIDNGEKMTPTPNLYLINRSRQDASICIYLSWYDKRLLNRPPSYGLGSKPI
jgi:hypothetical protein